MNRFIPIIGSDFVTADGTRITNFQLCSRASGKFLAVAVVDFRGDAQSRFLATSAMHPRRAAIVRLASIYRNRSTPQRL